MDRPTFRSYMNQPSRPGPVGPAQPNPARKVVSIPVHFVGSDASRSTADTSRSTSALRIQKVFRGFMVRKRVKQILLIRREVYNVEKRILGILDVIRRDAKERLRVNEMLMGLLFKLDSVPGLGAGVRECRKAVIKKVIFLQEIIDGSDQKTTEIGDSGECMNDLIDGSDQKATVIEDSGDRGNDSTNNTQDLGIEVMYNEPNLAENTAQDVGADVVDANKGVEIVESGEFDSIISTKDLDTDTMIEESEVVNEQNSSKKSVGNFVAYVADQALEIESKTVDTMEKIEDSNQGLKCNSEADEIDEDYCIVKKVVGETEGEDYDTKPIANQIAEDYSIDETRVNEQEDEAKATEGEELKGRDIMDRMVEENAKMMSMMKELAEQNRAQTEMLSLLSLRVEQLEKALVCEKLRKKMKDKKKRAGRGAIDDSNCCPDQKKCGKK